MKKFNWQIIIIPLLILVYNLIIIEPAGQMISIDVFHFISASNDFSLLETRPHFPGYPLHVGILETLNNEIIDKIDLLRLISITYTILSSIVLFLFLKDRGQEKLYTTVSLVCFTNPLLSYFTSSSEIYSFDLLFSILLLYLLSSYKRFDISILLLSIAFCLRTSSAIILFPAFVFYFIKYFKENKIEYFQFIPSLIVSILIIYLSFWGMIEDQGGIASYLNVLDQNNPIPDISFIQNNFLYGIHLLYFLPMLLLISDFSFTKLLKRNEIILFVIIPVLFFSIFHYSKAYLFLYILPLAVMLTSSNRKKYIVWLIVLFQIAFNFINLSVKPSFETKIKKSERTLSSKEIWNDRLRSYLLYQSSTRELKQSLIQEIRGLIIKTSNIHFDKSVYILAPELSLQLPNYSISYFDSSTDRYFSLNHDKSKLRDDVVNRLNNSHIILDKDMFIKYLSDLKIVKESDNYVLIKLNQKEIERYIDLCEKLYY